MSNQLCFHWLCYGVAQIFGLQVQTSNATVNNKWSTMFEDRISINIYIILIFKVKYWLEFLNNQIKIQVRVFYRPNFSLKVIPCQLRSVYSILRNRLNAPRATTSFHSLYCKPFQIQLRMRLKMKRILLSHHLLG